MFGEGFVRKVRNGVSPFTVVANRIGLTPYLSPTFDGVRVTGPDPGANWGMTMLIGNGEYEYPGMLPAPGDYVIDIGANVGLFALWATRHGATVRAFEPAPETFEHLRKNVQGRDVTPVHAAVVADNFEGSTAELFLDDDSSVGNTLVGHQLGSGVALDASVSVPVIRFDEVLDRPCSLLKLDCEGAEFPLLQDATDEQLRRAERIVVEFHRTVGSPATLVERLTNAGFDASIVDGAEESLPFGIIAAIRRDPAPLS